MTDLAKLRPVLLALIVSSGLCASGAHAAGGAASNAEAPALPPQKVRIIDGTSGEPEPVEAAQPSEVESYCLNIADRAQDARHALQEQQLKAVEVEITAKIEELEERRAQYQGWIAERKAFLDKASTIVVDIYAQMAADAAAAQLAKLGPENAAMILVRLKSRQASDVLSEMEPEDAAAVAKLIVEKTSTDIAGDGEKKLAENAS